jgi:hypothetical protein
MNSSEAAPQTVQKETRRLRFASGSVVLPRSAGRDIFQGLLENLLQ